LPIAHDYKGCWLIDQISLVEHNHRLCSAFPCRTQIALDTTQIEIGAQTGHQKTGIHIGRKHLAFGSPTDRGPAEAAAPRQDGMNGTRLLTLP